MIVASVSASDERGDEEEGRDGVELSWAAHEGATPTITLGDDDDEDDEEDDDEAEEALGTRAKVTVDEGEAEGAKVALEEGEETNSAARRRAFIHSSISGSERAWRW